MPGNNELDDFDSFNDLNDDGGTSVKLPEPKAAQDDDGGIEVDIVDDTPERDRKARPLDRPVDDPTDDELQNYGERARKRIGELTHARHDERRRAEALQRERDEAVRVSQELMRRTQQYEQMIQKGSEQFKNVSVEAAEAALKDAKAKLKQAKEDYDTDAEVEALAELHAAQLRLTEAKNFRPTPSQPVENDVRMPAQTEVPTSNSLDPKLQSWLKRNQWFNKPGNEEVTSFALGLHKKLVDSGLDPRSDDYYDRIDDRLKAKFPEVVDPDGDDTASRPAPRRSGSVVAPASRTTAPKKITLTASQVNIAKSLGLTPQQYAAQMIKESKNG